MTHKETIFFIAQCLTLSLDYKNKQFILKSLKSKELDWDLIIKLSTKHYVLPALYCNLKRIGFLKYIDNDLVSYMKHLTDLNKERNSKIILEVQEINSMLQSNKIKPIFIKGASNLIEGLYDDISERMTTDIDFLCSKEDYPKAIKVLSDNGYVKLNNTKYDLPEFTHYPRLINKNKVAGVEVHKELIIENYVKEFNHEIVLKKIQKINGINVLSFQHQLAMSIIADQINDHGFQYNRIALRNAYDVYLLSKRVDAKDIIPKFNKLMSPLNCFLAICFVSFGKIDSLDYLKTNEAEKHLYLYNSLLNNEIISKFRIKLKYFQLYIKTRLNIIYKSFFDKNYRYWLFERIFG